jgi:hypothetical protein
MLYVACVFSVYHVNNVYYVEIPPLVLNMIYFERERERRESR